MGEAAYNDAKAKGELLEQRLRKWLKTMKQGPAPRKLLADISEAADIIEWLSKERDSLIAEVAELRAERAKSKDTAFQAFMAGLGPSRWE